MQQNSREMLATIQQMREKMIESAQANGLSGVETIECSQELDKLIFEYQCLSQEKKKSKKERKITRKQSMFVWPNNIICI
ncbi:aspartyl-phosphate phosphatase Spo0E family protein [Robertmurraya korlensis]|uniref:Spo0E family sporulation regulatory protein-aspartic acid phosphatase n=1 Tax=Robertmurraya korlensis TaxID=519977 RepID=UPI00203D222B|nr:aspartyl-phosphate phosphatase Spo0E family protein [Robertmurraya korlensis]